jgi:hypothetical protein
MEQKKLLGIILTIALVTTILVAPILHPLYAYIVNAPLAPIAASGNNVYAIWWSNKTGNYEVFFRASHDNGKSFDNKINLSSTPHSNSAHADIAVSGDNVYVSFHDNKTGNVDTYMRASTDQGKTFGPIIAINGTGTLPQKSKIIKIPGIDKLLDSEENTKITVSGNNVYIVSWDKKTGNWEVFLARSTDGGKTFEKTVNLSNSSDTRSDRAGILADANNVYVAYWETAKNGTEKPVFRASNDNGTTFGPKLNLAANGPIGSRSGGGT